MRAVRIFQMIVLSASVLAGCGEGREGDSVEDASSGGVLQSGGSSAGGTAGAPPAGGASSGGAPSGGSGSGGETSSGGAPSGGSGSGGETSSGGSAPIGPCDLPSACSPGETRAGEACGNCGHRVESCSSSCEWIVGEGCAGEPVNSCVPGSRGELENCGFCGARQARCLETCEWESEPACENEQTAENRCKPAESAATTNSCGYCGTQATTCNSECLWVTSECAAEQTAEDRCNYKETETRLTSCGNCGTKTLGCTESCLWDAGSSCEGEPAGACAPQTTREVSCGEGDCGVRLETCSEACGWDAGDCRLPTLDAPAIACFPGQVPDSETCDEEGVDQEVFYSCESCRLQVTEGDSCGEPFLVVGASVGEKTSVEAQQNGDPIKRMTSGGSVNNCGLSNTTYRHYAYVEVRNPHPYAVKVKVCASKQAEEASGPSGVLAAYLTNPGADDAARKTCVTGSANLASGECLEDGKSVNRRALELGAGESRWVFVSQGPNFSGATDPAVRFVLSAEVTSRTIPDPGASPEPGVLCPTNGAVFTRSCESALCGKQTANCIGNVVSDYSSCTGPANACNPETDEPTLQACGEYCGTQIYSCNAQCQRELSDCTQSGAPTEVGEYGSCKYNAGELTRSHACEASNPAGATIGLACNEQSCQWELEEESAVCPSVSTCSSPGQNGELVICDSRVGAVVRLPFTQDQRGQLGIQQLRGGNACAINFHSAPANSNNVYSTFVEVRNATEEAVLLDLAALFEGSRGTTNPTFLTGPIAAYQQKPRLVGGAVTANVANEEWARCVSGSSVAGSNAAWDLTCPVPQAGELLAACLSQCPSNSAQRKSVPVPAQSSIWVYLPQLLNTHAAVSSILQASVVGDSCP